MIQEITPDQTFVSRMQDSVTIMFISEETGDQIKIVMAAHEAQDVAECLLAATR